jgi:hypothetical protein
VKTDAEGRFSLPAAYATEIVAVSREGYAEAKLDQLSSALTLTLQPWGRIEGTVRNGRQPATNEWVMVTPKRNAIGMHLQYDFELHRTQADEQGRFVLTNVPPGERFLTRLYPIERGWSWSHGEPITVKAGEVTRVDYGGKGRSVIGKVVPSDPKREIPWQTSGHHVLGTPQPRPPSNLKSQEEINAWNNSPEVKEARANYRYYVVRFDSDGSFRIDDVPPGKYNLSLHFYEPGQENIRMGRFIGSIQREVEVSAMANGPNDEPLDLGKLELVVQKGD